MAAAAGGIASRSETRAADIPPSPAPYTLWDVFVAGSLGITREVVKAPTAADAAFRVQWEFDWYRLPNTVLKVELSEDQSQKPDKVYQGRHQSVRA